MIFSGYNGNQLDQNTSFTDVSPVTFPIVRTCFCYLFCSHFSCPSGRVFKLFHCILSFR